MLNMKIIYNWTTDLGIVNSYNIPINNKLTKFNKTYTKNIYLN